MNRELMEALDILEKEKNISKDTLLEAIEQSLIQACKNHFGKADNVHVTINPETCDFSVYADRTVVEYVDDPAMEISWWTRRKSTPTQSSGCPQGGNPLQGIPDASPRRMPRMSSFRRSARRSAVYFTTSTMASKKRW